MHSHGSHTDPWRRESPHSHTSLSGFIHDHAPFAGIERISIFQLVLRHWQFLLLFTILGLIVAVLYIGYAPKIYEAEAVFEMNVRRPRVINNDAVFDDQNSSRDTDAVFNTRFEKFRSPTMEKLATSEFFKRHESSADRTYPSDVNKRTLAYYLRDAEWVKDADANVVRVSYASPYPLFAVHLVNVLSHCAGELMMEENRLRSDEAVKWLLAQVEEKREELEAVERQLTEVRKTVQLDALQQRQASLVQTMASVSEEREALISRIAERRTIHDFVLGLLDTALDVEMLPTGMPKEDQFNDLLEAWRTAHEEFLTVAGRYTDIHPEYRLAAAKEERALTRLRQFIDLSAKAIQNELNLLERQMDQINVRIEAMKAESLDIEQKIAVGLLKVQQVELKRDAADNSYQTMLRRIEEARLSADDNMAFISMIREATLPEKPVRPRKILVLFLCLVLAGGLGLLFAGLRELLLDRVRSVGDMRPFNLKILGVIPSQKKVDSRSELATTGLRDKFSPIVEIFAGINALLASGRYRDRSKVLLVCSAMPGDGKTITSCNLAISSAMNGSRTLLIDGDMRRPQLVNIFNIGSETPSLLEWLSSDTEHQDYQNLVFGDAVEGLDIITSRVKDGTNPVELLSRGHLPQLLDWARTHYDRIIIDSPPLGPVGDAQLWGNVSDSLVIVCRMGKTRRSSLRYALSRFEDSELPVLGCIINDVPQSLGIMFGGAYGYGYMYGYGDYH